MTGALRAGRRGGSVKPTVAINAAGTVATLSGPAGMTWSEVRVTYGETTATLPGPVSADDDPQPTLDISTLSLPEGEAPTVKGDATDLPGVSGARPWMPVTATEAAVTIVGMTAGGGILEVELGDNFNLATTYALTGVGPSEPVAFKAGDASVVEIDTSGLLESDVIAFGVTASAANRASATAIYSGTVGAYALNALTAGQWTLLPAGSAGEAWVYLPASTAWPSAVDLEYSVNDGAAQSLGVTLPGAHLITGLTDGDAIRLRRVGGITADWSDSKTFNETVDGAREATIFADAPANERPAPGGMTIVAAGVDATAAAAAKAAYDALLPITGGIDTPAYQDGVEASGLEQPLNLTNGTQVSIGSDGRLSITPSAAQAAADPLTAGVVSDTAGLIEEGGTGVDLYSNGAMGAPNTIDSNWTAGAGTPPSTLTSDGSVASGIVRWDNVAGITAGDEITFRWDMTRTAAGIKWLIIPETGFLDAVSGPYDDAAGTGKRLTLTAPAGTSFQIRVQSSASFIGALSNISITVGGFNEETLTLRVLPALGLHTWTAPSITHNLVQFLFDAPRVVGIDVTGRPFVVGATGVWTGTAWQSVTPGNVVGRGAGRLACVSTAGEILPAAVGITI